MSTAPDGTGVEDPRGPVDRGGDPPPAQGAGASVAGSGEPPAVADAAAAAEVPVEVTEVSGFTGSLAQALEQSAVPKPELGNYNLARMAETRRKTPDHAEGWSQHFVC